MNCFYNDNQKRILKLKQERFLSPDDWFALFSGWTPDDREFAACHAREVAHTHFGNKIYVFKSKSWKPLVVIKEFFGTIGSRAFAFFMLTIGMSIFVDKDILHFVPYAEKHFGWNEHFAHKIVLFWAFRLILGGLEVVFNYLINKLLLFRKKKGAKAEPAEEESTETKTLVFEFGNTDTENSISYVRMNGSAYVYSMSEYYVDSVSGLTAEELKYQVEITE